MLQHNTICLFVLLIMAPSLHRLFGIKNMRGVHFGVFVVVASIKNLQDQMRLNLSHVLPR